MRRWPSRLVALAVLAASFVAVGPGIEEQRFSCHKCRNLKYVTTRNFLFVHDTPMEREGNGFPSQTAMSTSGGGTQLIGPRGLGAGWNGPLDVNQACTRTECIHRRIPNTSTLAEPPTADASRRVCPPLAELRTA